jgi:hypothetical protein
MIEVKGQFFSLFKIRLLVVMMGLLSLLLVVAIMFSYIQYLEADTAKKLAQAQQKEAQTQKEKVLIQERATLIAKMQLEKCQSKQPVK